MKELLINLNLKNIMWIIPCIFFLHEMEEWNIYDWYHNTYQDPSPSTKLSMRIWLWLISIWGFLVTAISYVIPNEFVSAMVLLFLIVFTSFNGIQHIYWTMAFHKYAPGVFWSSVGLFCGTILTYKIMIQYPAILPYLILLYLITIPFIIQTIISKNTLTKTFLHLHHLTLKIADRFEQ